VLLKNKNKQSGRVLLYYCTILTARVALKKIRFAKSQCWGVIHESDSN
jgi:hypothetical protein